MDDYKKYEEKCQKIRKDNERLLKEFEVWLQSSGLSKKTIQNHVLNIDFYINEYLLYEDATEARDGVHAVGMFLGFWFIKKAMWSSRASLKGNAASLKKFYTFLEVNGMIDTEDLTELTLTIKEGMPDWLETLERYEDPSTSIEDVW